MGFLLPWSQILCSRAVNTNNGVEAINKDNYLPRNKSNLAVCCMVTTFLPEPYQKYLLQNYQMSGHKEHTIIFHSLLLSWKIMKCEPPLLLQNEQGKVPASTSCTYSLRQGILSHLVENILLTLVSRNALARTGNNLSFHTNTFFLAVNGVRIDLIPVNYLSSDYFTYDTNTLACE